MYIKNNKTKIIDYNNYYNINIIFLSNNWTLN